MNALLAEAEVEKIKDILIGQLGVQREQITPEARLEADLGADSLDKVEIAMKVEEEFGLTLPDEQTEAIETVEDLCETLSRVLGRGK